MENLKGEYQRLEQKTHEILLNLIESHGKESRHGHFPAIPVDVVDYEELALVDHQLLFLDSRGHYYSLFTEVTLEDLIDICESFN